MNVYVLWHINPESDDEKLLGVYSTKDLAELKIRTKYMALPGFCDYPNGFMIDEYEIDQDQWEEGFVTLSPQDATE